jgi:hypothetical protein
MFVGIISTTIQLEPKIEKSQHFSKIDYYGQLWDAESGDQN